MPRRPETESPWQPGWPRYVAPLDDIDQVVGAVMYLRPRSVRVPVHRHLGEQFEFGGLKDFEQRR